MRYLEIFDPGSGAILLTGNKELLKVLKALLGVLFRLWYSRFTVGTISVIYINDIVSITLPRLRMDCRSLNNYVLKLNIIHSSNCACYKTIVNDKKHASIIFKIDRRKTQNAKYVRDN